jgi:hypothetical protein
MLNSGPPTSPFPSSLVTDPAQEAIKKVGRDFLEAPERIPSDEGAVPRSKAMSAVLS